MAKCYITVLKPFCEMTDHANYRNILSALIQTCTLYPSCQNTEMQYKLLLIHSHDQYRKIAASIPISFGIATALLGSPCTLEGLCIFVTNRICIPFSDSQFARPLAE